MHPSLKKMSFVSLLVILLLGFTSPLFAATPYVLSVQKLREGLDKASQPSQKGFILIDVRTAEEHNTGFIPGTDFNIDFREIQFRHRELGVNLDAHLVVYCQSGHRSSIAGEILTNLGYQHVYNVAGSMNAWQEAGYPVKVPQR